MVLVGVTGGIGAGKTCALAQFEALGCRTLDADAIVHSLYEPGQPAHQAMIHRWGGRVTDKQDRIRRAAIADIVFESTAEREWLNALVHPLVQRTMREEAERLPTPLFCGVPLLYEVGWECCMNWVVVVWCNRDTQHQRLLARGWSQEEIERRLDCQMNMDEKLERADIGILNIGDMKLLRQQCEHALKIIVRANGPQG
ncbi:MAG: dephospho-CoA kinase [Lentisphaeria bacterium]|nr:dephospho-CoA kinase [Lentisphaeria bacterium]